MSFYRTANPRSFRGGFYRGNKLGSVQGGVNFDSVVLLMHFDGVNGSSTFTDSSSYNHTVTVNGNVQISTAQAKFNQSGYFDGDGDYLIVPSANFDLSTGDWTIELFARPSDLLERHLLHIGANDFFIAVSSFNGLHWRFRIGSFDLRDRSKNLPVQDVWQSLRLSYVDSTDTLTIYIDSSLHFQGGLGTNPPAPTGDIVVGRNFTRSQRYFFGFIDEFRIIKGVARDISTLPSSPYPDL